ncbi:outer membrane transport energization protein ExbD [Noviherbaspirillum humi]|uniref:Outer membrane transport energization protein ExbD n=1 Tax=Noviherbaspirillum humi TaxID=1688639 RepID=A0A239J495_9BURK|nr:biopolymer transporter ExbD [Noviherbaspirillum humi]SNT00640.1 outer membrane transport energization protein ExbD [Noviherbaspirillum humi]
MSFHPQGQDDEVMSEINMTPLVDVMLVLLIIFIITVPVINNAVKIDLPRAAAQQNDVKPAHVDLAIDADGSMTWNGAALTEDALKARVEDAAAQQPQPELHLRADRKTPYEKVAQVMAAAQAGGLGKIGFITDPGMLR